MNLPSFCKLDETKEMRVGEERQECELWIPVRSHKGRIWRYYGNDYSIDRVKSSAGDCYMIYIRGEIF